MESTQETTLTLLSRPIREYNLVHPNILISTKNTGNSGSSVAHDVVW